MRADARAEGMLADRVYRGTTGEFVLHLREDKAAGIPFRVTYPSCFAYELQLRCFRCTEQTTVAFVPAHSLTMFIA